MEGLERLETEVLELDNESITKIFNYLKAKEYLYEKFNNEEKTAEEMYDYIRDKARKHQKKGVAVIDDNVVYSWAVTYFIKSNETLGIKEKRVTPPTPAETIKKNEEKQKEKEQEKKQNDNQISMFQEV